MKQFLRVFLVQLHFIFLPSTLHYSKPRKSFSKIKLFFDETQAERYLFFNFSPVNSGIFPLAQSAVDAGGTNKPSIVMEMVEAIIDNNYDVNTSHSSRQDSNLKQKTEERDNETNSEAAKKSLRERAESQLSWETSTENRQRKVQSKGETGSTLSSKKAFNEKRQTFDCISLLN